MNTLKRIELFAVWRYRLKKRNGYNNSSGIIAHHTHLFCHFVTLCGLTRDFLHTSNYNCESTHIYWDIPKLCRWTVRKWGLLLHHTPKWRYQVTTVSLPAQFVLQSLWAAVLYGCRCRLFSCCAGNIRPVMRFEPRSFLLGSTCNLPPVLSAFPQYAFSYCLEWNLLIENLTRICTFGTGVWIRDDTRSSCIRRMLYMKSA